MTQDTFLPLVLIILVILQILSIYFCGKFAKSIFIKKGWNPEVGMIFGGLIGVSTVYIGIILLWLINTYTTDKSKSTENEKESRLENSKTSFAFYARKSFSVILILCGIGFIAIESHAVSTTGQSTNVCGGMGILLILV